MDLLSNPEGGPLPFIHIGADEVFNLASCKACRFFADEAGSQSLYTRFVRKVCKHLEKAYPDTEVLMWDDMLRNWSYQDLQKFRINGRHVAQPCVWAYSGNSDSFNSTIKT